MLKLINDKYPKNQKIPNKRALSTDNYIKSPQKIKQKREKIPLKDIFLYSWGKNKYGELGIGTSTDVNIPAPVTSLPTKNIIAVRSGGRNTILIKEDGSLYLCGSNIFGLLAKDKDNVNNELTQKTFNQIKYFQEKGKNIKDISIAEFHCLGLDIDGNVIGWGGNLFNKLGKKNNSIIGVPTEITIKNKIKSISCGDYHSSAISDDGILYTWGGGGPSYNHGQCGHGNLKDNQNPKKVEFFIKNNIKIKKVSCGGYHTVVLGENNEEDIYSFGKGIFGQLGYGGQESSSKPKKVLFNKKQNMKYEQNEKISIIDIKCGGEHSLFLSSNNHLYACGHGYLGQLGFGNNKNINSPLIVQSLGNKIIIEIAAGWSHSLVLTNEGNIYSTGCNKYGELGIGKKHNRYNYKWVSKLSKLNIKHISAGGHHSWCLLDNSEPLRKDKNSPEPLLKSNFTMNKKTTNGKKLLNLSQDSDESFSRNERKSNISYNKSSISVDNANSNKRRFRVFEDEEDAGNSFNNFNIKDKKAISSQLRIKKIIDDYNGENDMSVDELIDGIEKINNNIENSDNEDENNLDDLKDVDLDCELKIVYTDLNLSHRFIRFHSFFDYDKLKSIILDNFINKDQGIISYELQRDDEIEKNQNKSLLYISQIYNTIKTTHLINVKELSNIYTLGIVYDYKKNENTVKYKEKNKIEIKGNKKPIYGFKIINSEEILRNENNIEKELSDWIIRFKKIYNKFQIDEKVTMPKKGILFYELRPYDFYSPG